MNNTQLQSWEIHKILELCNSISIGSRFRISFYTGKLPYVYVANNPDEIHEVSKIVRVDKRYFKVSIHDSDWIGSKSKYGKEIMVEVTPIKTIIWTIVGEK